MVDVRPNRATRRLHTTGNAFCVPINECGGRSACCTVPGCVKDAIVGWCNVVLLCNDDNTLGIDLILLCVDAVELLMLWNYVQLPVVCEK